MGLNRSGEGEINTGFILKILGIATAAALFLIFLFGSWVIVPAGNRGVLLTNGKVEKSVLTPGLNFKWPIIQSVFKYNVQMRKRTFEDMTAASKDMQSVKSVLVINWTTNPESVGDLYENFGDWGEVSVRVLCPAVEQAFKDVTARYKVDEILANREKIREEFQNLLESKMNIYPIKIVAASITNISFSEEYEKAIEAKQVAEQNSKKAVYVAIEAKNMADAKVNEARGEAESKRLVSLTVTPKILALEWIKKWDGDLPQVMSGNAQGLMLNMNGLEKRNIPQNAE
jgi:regulator of protease activity HflC (stomatin/prohibitin superfamily)